MKYKANLIVCFAHVRYIIDLALTLALAHFIFAMSTWHGKLITFLLLTEITVSYSIKLLGRDYLNEFLDKLYKESSNDRKEERSPFEGSPE